MTHPPTHTHTQGWSPAHQAPKLFVRGCFCWFSQEHVQAPWPQRSSLADLSDCQTKQTTPFPMISSTTSFAIICKVIPVSRVQHFNPRLRPTPSPPAETQTEECKQECCSFFNLCIYLSWLRMAIFARQTTPRWAACDCCSNTSWPQDGCKEL